MRRPVAIVIGMVWVVISLTGGWLLVWQSFDSAVTIQLLGQTENLGARLAERIRSAPGNAATLPGGGLWGESEGSQSLTDELGGAARSDDSIAYAMVWSPDGEVVAHTKHGGTGHFFLDATKWPALEEGQRFRIARLYVPEWEGSGGGRVMEATVPVTVGKKVVGYVSVAKSGEILLAQFWESQGWLLVVVVGCSAGGLILLMAFIRVAAMRFEKSRREIVQEARARTSLLTERGMLASVLAHEIRSPLTAMRFNLHSLRQLVAESGKEGRGEKQAELTDRCEREIRRLDNMLTDFLHHTQVISAAQVEATGVNGVIREAMEFLRPGLERAGIRVSLHLDEADPRVNVHADELRQVILNLTANAQEAMQGIGAGKEKTLAISTIAEEGAEGGATATVLIRDSGAGISEETRERIFEPFFSTKVNGSGLGLTLVRRVVSGAGGTVLCESSVEKGNSGTTFRVVLPCAGGLD